MEIFKIAIWRRALNSIQMEQKIDKWVWRVVNKINKVDGKIN